MMKTRVEIWGVMTMDYNNIEVLTGSKKKLLDRISRKASRRTDYITVRIEQLTVERDNPNNSEEDSNWYNRIIQELKWADQLTVE
jgi:hypothetical protein